MKTNALYEEAQRSNITVISLPLPENGSVSIQTDGGCYIGMDKGLGEDADHRVRLAHELGHCKRGAFYNRWAARDVRQRYENRADKWAIEKLVPREELEAAVASGRCRIWELAEYFDVTEDFIRKAICWYTEGNLSPEDPG